MIAIIKQISSFFFDSSMRKQVVVQGVIHKVISESVQDENECIRQTTKKQISTILLYVFLVIFLFFFFHLIRKFEKSSTMFITLLTRIYLISTQYCLTFFYGCLRNVCRRNVHNTLSAKCPSAKCPIGELSVGEKSGWRNVYPEMSVGKMSQYRV